MNLDLGRTPLGYDPPPIPHGLYAVKVPSNQDLAGERTPLTVGDLKGLHDRVVTVYAHPLPPATADVKASWSSSTRAAASEDVRDALAALKEVYSDQPQRHERLEKLVNLAAELHPSWSSEHDASGRLAARHRLVETAISFL